MFDNLKAYFVENILNLHKEYLKVRKNQKLAFSSDLRSSINLATALYHFREHFAQDIQKSRKFYVDICPDYSLLGDVVNASKHSKLKFGNPQISNAENIYEQITSTKYKDQKGSYYHVEKTVIIKLDNETERDLHEIITNTINMWINQLKSLGIIQNYPLQKYKSNRLPRRNKYSGKIDIHSMHNLRFKAKFQLQKYNYEKKIVEPVDLTKAKVSMNFYQQIHTVDITITTKENKVVNLAVELTDSELKEYSKLKTQDNKIQYLFEKAKNQGLIKY